MLGANRARGSLLGMAIAAGPLALVAWFGLDEMGSLTYPAGSWPERFSTAQGMVVPSLFIAAGLLLLVLRETVRANHVHLPLLTRCHVLFAWFAGVAVAVCLAGLVTGLVAVDQARAEAAASIRSVQSSIGIVALLYLPAPYLFAVSLRGRLEQAERARTEHGWLS